MCYFLHSSMPWPFAWHSSSSCISVSIITFCFFLFVCIYNFNIIRCFLQFPLPAPSVVPVHEPTMQCGGSGGLTGWILKLSGVGITAAASCMFHWYCLQHRLRSKGWFFIFRPAWAGDAASRVPLSSSAVPAGWDNWLSGGVVASRRGVLRSLWKRSVLWINEKCIIKLQYFVDLPFIWLYLFPVHHLHYTYTVAKVERTFHTCKN